MNELQVHNPHNLPTIPYTAFIDFQGDLKEPLEPEELTKLKNSLTKHGVFVPKFVWFEGNQANILDGHQTKQALASLEKDGWRIPEIPYISVQATGREDAAEKLLQLNSKYAKFNPQTTWFESFEFGETDIADLLADIEIPELNLDNLLAPVTFDVPAQPYQTTIQQKPGTLVNYANIPPSQDRQMQPTPIEKWDDNDQEITQERGRVILVYQDNEQRLWLADKLGISFEKVIYPVKELRGF